MEVVETLEFAKADKSTLDEIAELLKQVSGKPLPVEEVRQIVTEAKLSQMLHQTDRYFLVEKPVDFALLTWEYAVWDDKKQTVTAQSGGFNQVNVFFKKTKQALPVCCGKGMKSTIVGMDKQMIGIAMECTECNKQYGVSATVTTVEEIKE